MTPGITFVIFDDVGSSAKTAIEIFLKSRPCIVGTTVSDDPREAFDVMFPRTPTKQREYTLDWDSKSAASKTGEGTEKPSIPLLTATVVRIAPLQPISMRGTKP